MGSSKTRSDGFRRISECLYRNESSGNYYAFIRHQGKLSKKSLKTGNLAQAKRKLLDLRAKNERIDTRAGKITLNALCVEYLATLRQSKSTIQNKETIQKRIKMNWPHLLKAEVQINNVKPADVRKWLASYDFGPATYNGYLWFIRGAFDFAIENKWLADNPADKI